MGSGRGDGDSFDTSTQSSSSPLAELVAMSTAAHKEQRHNGKPDPEQRPDRLAEVERFIHIYIAKHPDLDDSDSDFEDLLMARHLTEHEP